MKKRLFSIIALLLLISIQHGFTQNQKAEIKGRILEPDTKKPLPYATVAIYIAKDTTLITFRVSDDKGNFRAPGIPSQVPVRVVASMTGFGVYRKELTLTPGQVVDLGDIIMTQSSNLLKEVLVLAETPPIVVRKDTLEFNAASFKTLPTALVEDLLKKLPGVTVDGDGNIAVNGRAVNKILVDGKEFFGNDPKIATRNLPADAIAKVQVMNDPEALRRDPDMPASEIPQVVNLKLKKAIKQGMFGKLYAGAGGAESAERYEGGGILNIFRDTTQISILGYSNNLNRPGFGFEDVSRIGGFNRSGMNMMMMRSDGGFAINDISFGATGEGIQQSTGGGGNFNTILKNGLKGNLQYFFGQINSDLEQVTNANQFLDDFTLNTLREREQSGNNASHRFGGKLEGKLDSLTNFSIAPSFSLNSTHSKMLDITNTTQNNGELINQSNNQQSFDNSGNSFSTVLSLDRSFKKKGRTLTVYGNTRIGGGTDNQFNNVLNSFYAPQNTTRLDQLRENDRHNTFLSSSLQYAEPFSKTISGILRVASEYFNDQNTITTYSLNPVNSQYENPIPDLSNFLTRDGWRNNITTSLRWRKKDFSIQPGVRFSSIDIDNKFRKNKDLAQHFFYINPSVNITWKQLNLSYNANVREPNASDLQPVINNTNPLFIVEGNPALKPTVANSLNFSYRKYDAKRLINFNAYTYGTMEKNSIIRERFVSPDGVQTTRPVNTNGVWQVYGSFRASKDYKFNAKYNLSFSASLWSTYNKTLIILNNEKSNASIWGLNPTLESRINLNDKIEFNQSFGVNNNRSYYSGSNFQNRLVTYRSWRPELIIRTPRKLVWEANLEYRYNSDVAPGFRSSFNRLNAAVTYLFLKNDRAQLKFSVYDLLNQNVSIYRYIRENIVEDTQTTVLTRYGLVTLTYNIKNFGGKVGGSNNNFFRF